MEAWYVEGGQSSLLEGDWGPGFDMNWQILGKPVANDRFKIHQVNRAMTLKFVVRLR